ncbi:MAG: XTP/dITP diphosphatase [Endomicrobium sp.]|jgi:XTP/dITP diphosphohydrolase|nr:XTP/dITP diphosphatase [Endomicrobium sp.]
MIEEIILATSNKQKVEEMKKILNDLEIKVIAMTSFCKYPETDEDGKTLEENAIKKAKDAAKFFNKWTLADDSGLEVDWLNGEPGVYSARYAGEDRLYDNNNKKLLLALKGVPFEKRTAKFRTVIVISSPNGEIYLAEGKNYGIITLQSLGNNGFGYDPVFYVPEYKKTFAELSINIKNSISHRAIALQKAKEIIKSLSQAGE